MKKLKSRKKPVRKLKPTAHKLGGHPDLRTKAGRAWKAQQASKVKKLRDTLVMPDLSAVYQRMRDASKLFNVGTHYIGDRCEGGHLPPAPATPMYQQDSASAPGAYSRVLV